MPNRLCSQDPTAGECELALPPVCSRDPAASTAPTGLCEVTAQSGAPGRMRVQVSLKAATGTIRVGGYAVPTENYNASYLSPVVEAHAGDTVAARVTNLLDPRQPPASPAAGHAHNATDNPTNLHFFTAVLSLPGTPAVQMIPPTRPRSWAMETTSTPI